MRPDDIITLAKHKKYAEAIDECNKLLAKGFNRLDVLRTRAYVLALRGDYLKALMDWNDILQSKEMTLGDYYLSANDALEAGQFSMAVCLFEKLLAVSHDNGESYFNSGAQFLRAFALMKLRRYDEALLSLRQAVATEGDIAMPVPDVCGLLTHEELREEILRRRQLDG